jgi:mannitol-1-phosphate 5-dehydrogenase
MSRRTFVGFGFGAIQGGLFLLEAHRSGNFDRLVVAEVVQELVDAVRRAGGRYHVNVATAAGIEDFTVANVEILNPLIAADQEKLIEALAEASEIATALPSVEFYQRGGAPVTKLLAQSLSLKSRRPNALPCVIYTAENHNRAAEILQEQCEARLDDSARAFVRESAQFLNTVIGKMSGVVTDAGQIHTDGLACLVENYPRAFLVEEFNRIFITQIRLPGFRRGIEVFVEKPDLLPFEEAKLYGHNAIHALIGFLAHHRGHEFMSAVTADPPLLALARAAFLGESGNPLMKRHAGVDPLFTPAGWRAYAEDLLARMANPHLRDRVERVIRDPRRKLGWDDRLIGTMRLALEAGVTPGRFALGAAAAAKFLDSRKPVADQLNEIWVGTDSPVVKAQLIRLIAEARLNLQPNGDILWNRLT